MPRRLIVGVMGGGAVDPRTAELAYRLGQLIADAGWILLNGGRNCGVMAASARGARERGGLTVGVLPDADRRQAAPWIDVAIVTGMGSARNAINVLSSDVVVACAGGAGTLSEIALALKAGKTVILLDFDVRGAFAAQAAAGRLLLAATPEEATAEIRRLNPTSLQTHPA
jgi:uncharacterized protein (TIGR00725 family)